MRNVGKNNLDTQWNRRGTGNNRQWNMGDDVLGTWTWRSSGERMVAWGLQAPSHLAECKQRAESMQRCRQRFIWLNAENCQKQRKVAVCKMGQGGGVMQQPSGSVWLPMTVWITAKGGYQ
uniref:HDC17338 n=1 Tax=Drosophila melanogaster TaxID=7227 RepID=Q6IIQ7_DROME|nr:TPA_inf: HDC17338 [Drosophila melanogaster]